MRYADGEILHLLGIRKFELCFKKLSDNVDISNYELEFDKFDCLNIYHYAASFIDLSNESNILKHYQEGTGGQGH